MQNFYKLNVWEKSHKLSLIIYEITKSFPKDERFRLVDQLTRSVSSIPTNISEGCGQSSTRSFIRYLQIAFGSAMETEYLILLSKDLSYIDLDTFQQLTYEVIVIKKMLSKMIKSLERNDI